MAVSNTARKWITIVDLNDGRTLNFGISANGATTQIYNPDSGIYNADFTTNNLTLTPFLYITGESNNMISQVSNVTWTINGGAVTNWGSVGSSSPYALTINHNLTSNTTSLLCKVTGTFTDPVTLLTTTVVAEQTITRLDTAGSTLACILTYPGASFFYNDTVANVQIQATMYCGTTADTTNVQYEWYRYSSGGWTKITSSNHGTISGYTGRTITIYPDDVDDIEQFKCIVKDTDQSSGTYNKTAEAISAEIRDLSDPYDVFIYCPAGDKLTPGAPSTTLEAIIMKGGEQLDPNDSDNATLYSHASFEWTMADKTGDASTTWGTNGKKTTRTITVTRQEIKYRATYFVKVTIS